MLCAAGEATKLYGAPYDSRLWVLGDKWFNAMLDHAFDRADDLLDAIDDRALQLKREYDDWLSRTARLR